MGLVAVRTEHDGFSWCNLERLRLAASCELAQRRAMSLERSSIVANNTVDLENKGSWSSLVGSFAAEADTRRLDRVSPLLI